MGEIAKVGHGKKRTIAILIIFALICCTGLLLNLNRLLTVMSIEKIDDYPLYYMRYYGDYHLNFSPVGNDSLPIGTTT